ncbi:transcriptional regulator [Glaciecola sp. 1036]|uniref:transcriptional regulator n=1 Tax=Alteromonadaceae TaxID=72275 RepID=UPI003CFCD578
MSEDEYIAFQNYWLTNPNAGVLIRGSGGVRKVRWVSGGTGKSGGVRIIYHLKQSDNEIWMLTIYGKSEVDTIQSHILKQIAKAINDE